MQTKRGHNWGRDDQGVMWCPSSQGTTIFFVSLPMMTGNDRRHSMIVHSTNHIFFIDFRHRKQDFCLAKMAE